MNNNKFFFNKETLKYSVIEKSYKKIFYKWTLYFFASILIAFVYYIVFSTFFDTPKELELKREKNELASYYSVLLGRIENSELVLKDIQQRDDNIYRTIFAKEPIPVDVRLFGIGGTNMYTELERFSNSDIVIKTTKALDMLSKKLYVQSKSFDEIVKLAKSKEDMLRSIPAIQPVSNKDLKRMASPFGIRIHPFYKVAKMHYGMDFTAPTGTEIYATGDATVLDVQKSERGYGNNVILNHGFGYETLYAHCAKILVRKGQKIKRGQVIALVGSTGMSLAPHLHYEVHVNGKPVDPINFYFNDLSPQQYDDMIQLASTSGQTFD